MDSIRRAVALACGVLAAASAPALEAASLGEIEIRSALNSPLDALLRGTAGDIAEDAPIDVRIVDPAWAGDPGLKARVRGGTSDIVITSVHPVSEPMFTLRLQLRADGVVLSRDYPVILDLARPAEATQAPPAQVLPSQPAPAAPAPPAVAVAKPTGSDPGCGLATPEGTPGFDSARNVYGPVTDGESLRLVALRVRPWRDCMALDTLMAGIYAHNAGAFYGAPDRLRAGQRLQVPSLEALRSNANGAMSRSQPPSPPTGEVRAPKPAGLLLTGFVGAAHAAPREADIAALEVTPPARLRPAPARSSAVATLHPPLRSTQSIPAWVLALALSSCAILVLLKWPAALGSRGLARPPPARARLPTGAAAAAGPVLPAAAPEAPHDPDGIERQLPLSFMDEATFAGAPAMSAPEPRPRAVPAPALAAGPAAELDPWENLNLQNRRLTGHAVDEGIDDTSLLVRVGHAGAEPDNDPSPELTEIVDLLKATLRRQPTRLDVQMKLFDIYHGMRMTHAFQQEARKVSADAWATRRVDWTAIGALWEDLSPGSQLLEVPAAAPVVPSAPPSARNRRFADVAIELAGGALDDLAAEYDALRADPEFLDEVGHFAATLLSRPTPLTTRLSSLLGGDPLFLKREDQRAISPEVDNALVQAIVAQIMGRKRLVTGNDSEGHSLALAMAAARLQMECVVYLRPSELCDKLPLVSQLRLLGARIETTDAGAQILSDSREGALLHWMSDPQESFLALSLGTGPHPYPLLVSDARSLLGRETLEQFRSQTGRHWPAIVVAAAASRADSIGFVLPYLQREDVRILIAQAPASGSAVDPGPCHGLQREHAWLRSTGRVEYVAVSQQDAGRAMEDLASFEGICVSPGDAGAVALARSLLGSGGSEQPIVVLVA